ncbi:unnamed protein product, partial [Coregonus sp. 'balchen']
MEEAPLDLGPGEMIMTLTEVTTEDLVEQEVAVETNGERKEEEQQTLFAMSLVPTLKRLPQQRKAAVKVKIHQLLFEAEFNGRQAGRSLSPCQPAHHPDPLNTEEQGENK